MASLPWLILPTFNEAENLEGIVDAAGPALAAASPEGYRILVVDDSSPDGTGEIADRLAREREEVEVLHRSVREGLGPAYIAGFRYALERDASCCLEMDCDFSHDPADLTPLLDEVLKGRADLALGSRYVEGGGIENWNSLRRLVSRGGSLYAQAVLTLPVQDLTGGFKCFRADVLRAIDLDTVRSRGYAFQVELTYRAMKKGFRIVEVPIVFHDRREGESKMTWQIVAEAAWLVPALRFRR